MKLRILSDLHLEGQQFNYQYQNEDAIVLAGDIHTRNRHDDLLAMFPSDIPILFVVGNHEYYHGDFDNVNRYLTGLQDKYSNFHFLNNSAVEIGDVTFFGGTMFSDLMLGDNDFQQTAAFVNLFIADFSVIGNGDRTWSIEDHLEQHELFCHSLETWLETTQDRKRVIISHFVPSSMCIDRQFAGSALNPYFTSNMERYMDANTPWIFGHTHTCFDLEVPYRLVCNPKGYGNENPRFDPNKVIVV